MTDTLSPQALATEQDTKAWSEFARQLNSKDWGLPRGTYPGVLHDVTTVRRRDTGAYALRLLALVQPRDRYALTWAEMGTDARDPYALTARQMRALAKLADGLGILTPAPAEEIVDGIAHLVGRAVEVKVIHTPIGPRATFTRGAEGELIAPEESRVDQMHAAQELLLASLRRTREGLAQASRACHLILEGEGWSVLGYSTLREYLASPELGLRRSTFFGLANIYRRYVVEGGLSEERLGGAESSKLGLALPAIAAGKVTAEEAANDAEALGWRDMKEKYRDVMAEPSNGSDPGPDEAEVCESCGRPL